jgi:AraC-like DNA-binding protein
MKMKQYSVRVDDRLSQILERNAENQGIKVTRYVRSLIEKGLVIDTQIQQGVLAEKIDKSKSYFDLKIAELVAQNVALSRKLLRKQFKNEEIGQDEIQDAERRAKEVIARLIEGEG